MFELLLLSITLIVLGLWNWQLQTKLNEANEQISEYQELLVDLATELQDLGSPNVKVIDVKSTQEH